MATPIKITPVLKGNDAVYFYKQLEKSVKRSNTKRKVSTSDRKKISSVVSQFLKRKVA